ncbi:phosphatidylinositol 4-phosphate 3-kinase C2 domain-containing subunit gamma [Pelobates cultripes]|uniref:Phosphatidylinositol 4-phosphate 3-kinase C2 domain-containing subunit gamma n=1 Tax=Pelobates cultripes TaxID=61616 RepID=A0AAD1RVF6_PELCU|nr:phosphatidylinositol 4-phosphate 3-kinase C2 domain-containing subunit gamma [Pelobates cultripes]
MLLVALSIQMLQAGLPELRDVQDLSYMQNNLRPQDSDIQATSYFTKKIQESLECFPVKLNNFIHILANTSLTDKASLIKPSLPNARKVLQNLTKAGVRKLHEKSERLLNKLGNTAYHQSYAGTLRDHNQRASIQLCLSFKDPELSVLVKHLKNVHFSTASIEICLLSNLGKTSVQRVKSHKSSSALTFNKIVKFYVPQSDRHELQVVVKSKDVFLGSVNILLNQVHFNEDLWYPLTNSTT